MREQVRAGCNTTTLAYGATPYTTVILLVGGGEVLVERPVGDVGDVRAERVAWGQEGRGLVLENVGDGTERRPSKVEDWY